MFHQYYNELIHNPAIVLVAMAVILDTIFGLFRAIKEKKFNSNFGIDGAIRKSGMLISVLFLMLADYLVKINLIFFIPDEIRKAAGLEKVGLGEFFCILYLLYEIVSILKNMYLCGLPIPGGLKPKIEKLLTEMTDEVTTDNKEKNIEEQNKEEPAQ